jgi:hypothetical protein
MDLSANRWTSSLSALRSFVPSGMRTTTRSAPSAASRSTSSAVASESIPTLTRNGRWPRPGPFGVYDLQARGEFVVAAAADLDPAVGEAARAAQSGGRAAADLDRDRPLERLGLEVHPRDVVVLAAVLDHRLGPEPPQQRDDLVGPLAACCGVEPDDAELLLEPAHAGTEGDPTSGEPIDGQHAACGDERVAQREDVDVGAEPDRLGDGGDRPQQYPRVVDRGGRRDRRLTGGRVEVGRGHDLRQDKVVGYPHRLEAGRLGLGRERGVVPWTHPTQRQSEPHHPLPSGRMNPSSSLSIS